MSAKFQDQTCLIQKRRTFAKIFTSLIFNAKNKKYSDHRTR